METYDAIIIGFGKGGKTLAGELAAHGQRVAMVERSDKMYGGTCINIACIPTKTLVHQAKVLSYAPNRDFPQKARDYREAVARKNEVTGFLRGKNYAMLADNPQVTVITGSASFRSPHEIAVETAQETLLLRGEKIFINTGAETILPDIEGLRDSARVYTSTSMLELETLPRRLVIVGGGYIGMEYASCYAMFGAEVTLLERHARLLGGEDADIADSVRSALEKRGVRFLTETRVLSLRDTAEETEVRYADAADAEHVLAADAVLVATGRRPHTAGLRLEAAGVSLTEQGAVAVDDQLRTSVPHIWALGDVKGGPQFTYISLDDYRIVRDALFGAGKRRVGDRAAVAYAVFMDPPLARIGLSEDQARLEGRDVKVAVLPAAAIPRARLLGETDGLLKAVVDARSGEILGCALHCVDAGEVINSVALAMRAGQDYTFLRDMIFTHPSMSEALNDLFGKVK